MNLFDLCTTLRAQALAAGYARGRDPVTMQAPSGMGIDIEFYTTVKIFEVSTFDGKQWSKQDWWISKTATGPSAASGGDRFTQKGAIDPTVVKGLEKGLLLPGDGTLFGIRQGGKITGLMFTCYNEATKFLVSSYYVASGSKPIDGLFTPYGGKNQLNAKKWHTLSTVDLTKLSLGNPPYVHQGNENGKGLFWLVNDWAGKGTRLFEYSKFTGLVTPEEAIELRNKR
jgi:hypothetical protein